MEDTAKLALIAKRKADAEKRAKLKRINNMYSVIASEMPADWVKQDNNRVALVEAIHKDILGLDRTGRMRPMGDFVRFMNVANQAGLNPFLNEIYAIYFYDKSVKGEKLNVVTGIHGLRKAAAMDTLAVMRYVGEGEPVIEFKTTEQKARLKYADMFDEIPHKVTTEIKGLNPVTGEIQTVAVGIAYWDEYVSLIDEKVWENGVERKTGRKVPNSNWASKPIIMLKKCFDTETEVLTDRGFMLFENVEKSGANVLQVTENGVEPTDAKPFVQKYNGEMVKYDTQYLNFCVTPNHDMVVDDGKKIEAGDMYEQLRIRPKFHIPFVVENNNDDADITDNEIMLAAWYLADGYTRTNSSFYVKVNRGYKIKELNELPFISKKVRVTKASVRKNGRTIPSSEQTEYRFDKNLVKWLCQSKESIDFDAILKLSKRQARLFVDTLILCDGNIMQNGVRRFFQTRPSIVRLFELASVCAGYAVNEPKGRISDLSVRTNYFITVSGKTEVPVTSRYVKKINYDGDVWCVTVPSGKIVVRRHGLSMVCGNCAAADGLRKAYPNRLNAIYERAEVEHSSDTVDIDVEEQENEQIKKINEAVNQRRSKGNVFEQKAKEAIGN